MANSLKQFIVEMCNRVNDGDGFGRIETVTGLAAQTVTVAALAVGSKASTVYEQKWLWRPDAALSGGAQVDRQRMCSLYTSLSGLFTQAGAAYTDTTVGSPAEQVGILEYEPAGKMATAVNLAVARLRFRDVTGLPTTGAPRYWLGQFSWLNEPGDVVAVYYSSNPVLSRNRYYGKWNQANADTAAITAVPESWTAYGAGATYQRVTASTFLRGQYGVSIVAPGGNVVGLSQAVGILNDGITGDNLQGKIVTVVGVAQQSVASKWRAWYSDDGGTTKQYTAFSTNTMYPTESSLQITVSTTASNPTCGIEIAAGATVIASECYLVLGALSDSVRKDTYGKTRIPVEWDQTAGPAALQLVVPNNYALGGTLEVHSQRAYPPLTLDTDTCDAPLTTVAVMALRLLYRGLMSTPGQDNSRYEEQEARWRAQAASLQAKHFARLFPDYGWDVFGTQTKSMYPYPNRVG